MNLSCHIKKLWLLAKNAICTRAKYKLVNEKCRLQQVTKTIKVCGLGDGIVQSRSKLVKSVVLNNLYNFPNFLEEYIGSQIDTHIDVQAAILEASRVAKADHSFSISPFHINIILFIFFTFRPNHLLCYTRLNGEWMLLFSLISMIKHILATRFMEYRLSKYHQIIIQFESSKTFYTLLKKERVHRDHHPHIISECVPNALGVLTPDGFRFCCRHFAVTYKVDGTVPIDSTWHTMRHITLRNQITAHILEIIAEYQCVYLQSANILDLSGLPYAEIVAICQRKWPETYMDNSIVSRVVKSSTVYCHSGQCISLSHLLPSKSQRLGYRIDWLLKNHDPNMNDLALTCALIEYFGVQVKRRYVSACREKMGIPSLGKRMGKGCLDIPVTCLEYLTHLIKRHWPSLKMWLGFMNWDWRQGNTTIPEEYRLLFI